MDPAVVASLLAAVFGAILGSVVGPFFSAWLDRAGTRSTFIRDQRREAYTNFTVSVEEAQRKADATVAGVPSATYSLSDLDELELARVKIDLFGAHLAKVWAYRCTLALIALEHGIREGAVDMSATELPRAKLHEARGNLVRVLRVELGISGHDKDDGVSRRERRKTKAEARASQDEVNSTDHKAWLNQLPTDLDVSKEAIAVYKRSAIVALREDPTTLDEGV